MPVAYLTDRAVLRIAGPEASSFLQHILTLDIDDVTARGSGYGALLTPQGKILFDFILHKAADGFLADIRADHAESFAKRLALYKLRAKVEIAPAPDLAVFAEWPGSGEGPADPRLAELGSRFVAPADSIHTDSTAADWHAHRIAHAVPEGGLDFAYGDAFPHDAAMDSLHGIAFDKGCYVGQEVVSRMRHRGTARRRIVALHAKGLLPEPGTEIVAGERPLGRLGSSAGERGIGLLRLDRRRTALNAGLPVRAGPTELDVALPAWATYGWPVTAGEAED